MEKVKFNSPVSQEIKEFFCLEQTKINNQNYLLVTEEEDGDSDAYILKEISSEGEDTVYDHLKTILDFSAREVGARGICKGLRADWNDCLNLGGGRERYGIFPALLGIAEFCGTGSIPWPGG